MLSAFCSAARQNLASVLCRHSFAEAVLLFSLALFRLVSSQHIGYPPFSSAGPYDQDSDIIFLCRLFQSFGERVVGDIIRRNLASK